MPDVILSAAGLRIVKLLVGRPPQTVSELIEAAGVTRTAVTEQLHELTAAGLVERETQRQPGRGRPRHLYRATNAAMARLFAGRRQQVVQAMWQAILDIGGEELVQKVIKKAGRALADDYNRQITAKKPKERLRQLVKLLAAEGGLVDLVEGERGHLVFRRRSCPFVSMADQWKNVCRMDQEMLGAVVGRPVRRVFCRYQGDPCCAFEIVGEEKA